MAFRVRGQVKARANRKDLKKAQRHGVRHFANVGRKHPDYGLTPAEHWAAKKERGQ